MNGTFWRRLLAHSAVGAVLLGASAGDIVINEIHYHPLSGKPAEEFVELHNLSGAPVNLAGWNFTRGIRFSLPPVSIPAGGFLVVAADTNVFAPLHPGVTSVVGNWTGTLGNNGEAVRLEDAAGDVVDEVTYASQGDWGERRTGPTTYGFSGLVWAALHDGQGRTLERINPNVDGNLGQNWAASSVAGGSPGATNGARNDDAAPFIAGVTHSPAVPRPAEAVAINARVFDDSGLPPTVKLFHRVDGEVAFEETPMADDGQHGDGLAGNQVFGAVLPSRAAGTVVEYYISASDGTGHTRSWPAPRQPDGAQVANALYQVDDSPSGELPRYRLVFTAADKAKLDSIEAQAWYATSDAEINATFVSTENGETEVRHRAGFRSRGTTTRDVSPPSRRVEFPDDDRWHGVRAINLNAVNPQSQVGAAALARLAGLPSARSRLVEIRENGVARSGSGTPVPGVYAHNEAVGSEYCDATFPGDGGGNLYHADGNGNLDYLGPDPAPYTTDFHYTKETNSGEDDWSDLIEMTRVLNQAPEATFVADLKNVADPAEWVRYFAVNILLANTESSLHFPRVTHPTPDVTVVTSGDYLLYRGEADPRFLLVPYDWDSCLGTEQANSWSMGIYEFKQVPAVARLLRAPEFGSLYHAELRRLADTVFSKANVSAVLDQLLGGHLPAPVIQAMKDFNEKRRGAVLAALPAASTVTTKFPNVAFHNYTTQETETISGTAATPGVASIRVSGVTAQWNALEGKWQAGVPLLPGVNRLEIESVDSAGHVLASQSYYLWRDVEGTGVSGTLAASATWRAADGPFLVTNKLVIPQGLTLTIEAGTTLFFNPGGGIQVQGRLRAEGTGWRRIRMTTNPRTPGRWSGIAFDGARDENRLVFVDMALPLRSPLVVSNSVVLLDHVTWPSTSANILQVYESSLTVRGCTFPSLSNDEIVQGVGLPADGHLIFDGNTFGTTTGYNDIIDFTGGKRPKAIMEVLNNIFLGGGDDGLDLDGTDAHVEGNVFMHFHKDALNQSTSISSAIATGRDGQGITTDVVIARNVFYDNDHDVEFKDYATLVAEQNTFVGQRFGSIACSEPERPLQGPPTSGRFSGNIWWNSPHVFVGLDPGLFNQPWFVMRVDNSLLPEPGPWSGTNNLRADPRFVNPTNDFHLLPASPALRAGPAGRDLGAYVPAGAVIIGAPATPTTNRSAILRVIGPGLTHYRAGIDGGALGPEVPLSQPIELSALAIGSHSVRVRGRNSAGSWQPEPGTEATWEVVADFSAVRLNELLAKNTVAVPVAGKYPDLVELHNPGTLPVDLSGLGISDDPTRPQRYVFPAGTQIPPGGYLVCYADKAAQPPGIHLGFGLADEGNALYLTDTPARGGQVLDSVVFGAQLPDFSLGRLADGTWTLTLPTFGSSNIPQPLGDSRRLRLNEWLAHSAQAGEDDFIELMNPESLPVSLDGLGLTDGSATVRPLSPLPAHAYVASGGFVAFKADGNGDQPGHVGFSLEAQFGSISLVDDAGNLLDSVTYASQRPDFSSGRLPDGSGPVRELALPSPGLANSAASPTGLLLSARRLTPPGFGYFFLVSGTQAGRRYRLESSTTGPGGWESRGELMATGQTLEFFEPAGGETLRLYRAVVAP